MSGQVNVEVDAAPQEDLTKVLADMREHYETVTAKSRRDLEGWFQQKLGLVHKEVKKLKIKIIDQTLQRWFVFWREVLCMSVKFINTGTAKLTLGLCIYLIKRLF